MLWGSASPSMQAQVAKHLKNEHGQGIPSRLLQAPTAPTPSPSRVPRDPWPPSPSASGLLQTKVQEAPAHVVPRYDIYGFSVPDPPPTDAAKRIQTFRNVPAPAQWERTPTHNTNSALQQARRRAQRPHDSYDIDGDGFVSARDFEIAKRFDGRSAEPGSYGTLGRLTAQEQRAAIAEDMGRMATELPPKEFNASVKGSRLLSQLSEEPEMNAYRRGPIMGPMKSDVYSLWNRSSFQAKDCMNLPLGPPPPDPHGRVTTRSALKENMRRKDTQANQEQYYQYKATHPVQTFALPESRPLEPGRAATRTELKASQRQALAPHLTYDLDGDGYVSQDDLRTAAMFESDNTQGLSPREVTEARHALAKEYSRTVATAASQTGGSLGLHGSLARQHLETFQGSPDAPNAGGTLRQAGFYSRLAELRSSHNVNDCLSGAEPEHMTGGQTRSAMLQTRRHEMCHANDALKDQIKTSFPKTRTAGAPGKNPQYKKFTYDDVKMRLEGR